MGQNLENLEERKRILSDYLSLYFSDEKEIENEVKKILKNN